MAFVTQVPINPAISAAATQVPAGSATNFRPALNTYVAAVETKAERAQAFLELLIGCIGNGAISGGAISASVGLAVSVAALSAFVGNFVAFDASQTVGGLYASQTNYLFLRQDGTWTINITGSAPTDIAAHGAYFLWGTATTDVSSVLSVTNDRDSFRLQGPLVQQRDIVNSSEAVIVGAEMQTRLLDTLTVYGTLLVYGKVRVTD